MVERSDGREGQESEGGSGSGSEKESATQRVWERFTGGASSAERSTEATQPVEIDFVEIPLVNTDDELVCQVCGIPLVYAGRGRKPKFCDEHRTSSARTSGGKARQSSGKASAANRIVQEGIADNVRLVGTGVGMAMPTTGYVLVEDSDVFAQAIVRLCANNPRAMKALSKAAQASPAFQVGKSLARIGTAVNVDTGRMQPDTALVRGLGVFKAWQETHPNQSSGDTYTVQPAPGISYLPTG